MVLRVTLQCEAEEFRMLEGVRKQEPNETEWTESMGLTDSEMDQNVALVVVVPGNLTLSRPPHGGGFGREHGQWFRLPTLLTAPKVLVLGQVKGIRGLDSGQEHVAALEPAVDTIWRTTPDVDVV